MNGRIFIDSWHDASGSVRHNGRLYRFDFSRRFGPLWMNADGSSRKDQNVPQAVWSLFEKWLRRNWKQEWEVADG